MHDFRASSLADVRARDVFGELLQCIKLIGGCRITILLECPASALTGARPNCWTLWNNAGLRDASAWDSWQLKNVVQRGAI